MWKKYAALVFAAATIFIACSHSIYPVINGTIEKGIYSDPKGYFSIEVPCFNSNSLVSDEIQGDNVSVALFIAEDGEVFRIEAAPIPDPLLLHICRNGLGEKQQLEMYHQIVVEQTCESFDDVEVAAGEFVQHPTLGLAYFSAFKINKASPFLKLDGVPEDIYRGFLIVMNAEQIVTFAYMPDNFMILKAPCWTDYLKNQLINLSMSYKFLPKTSQELDNDQL